MNFKNLKLIVLSLVVTVVAIAFQSCSSKDDEFAPETVQTRATVTIPANTIISGNTTWSSSNDYLLEGKVWVDNGGVLTIQAGTTVKGAYNSNPDDASAIVVTRGGQIIADGTATSPIIMTAANGTIGGWGGLVLLGNAVINQGTAEIEGIKGSVVPAGLSAEFGGNDDTDNSGILRYVRVEYAGAAISDANELNAFTFGGVGSGTTLDHLQAYYGNDDSFEFFGGTVDAKYLVSTSPNDDSFDFDFGYRGRIQFAVATMDGTADYSSDPNGIECDNDGSGSGATPFTHPVLSNLTIVGTSNGQITGTGGNPTGYLYNGARFRRNTQYTLVNSVIYGYPTGVWNNTSNTSTVENNVVWATTTAYKDFSSLSSTNYTLSSYNDIVLTDPFGDYYNTNALKPTGAPANTAGYDINAVDSWFDDVEYLGAVDKAPRVNSWLRGSWIK